MPRHPRFSHASWFAVGATVVSTVGGAIISSDASRKAKHAQEDALAAQKDISANLKYEPVDLAKLKADAQATAIENATNSLQIERSLQPNVAGTREGLAKTVNEQLAMGGRLPPDIANQVMQAGRTAGSASGVGGNSAPLSAALIGQTALGLQQQRQDNASQLLAMNQLPVAGLDPGALASVEVANNAAQNQFNLEKSGVASNLAQSQANIQAGAAGSNASMWNNLIGGVTSIAGMYGKSLTPAKTPVTSTYKPATVPTYTAPSNPFSFNSTIPQASASGLW